MLRDITFGQYFDADSIIHKLDPRIKLILLIAYIVFIFVATSGLSLAFAGLIVIVLLVLSKVPIKPFAKNIRAILPI
ncbi:MAG: energy-coupling factor transporter transmembrane protein EcfT, partial [Oscillospiraceae bacterium]|nr:energy-coupling factor transporter transmembrane protein EcfT [Candidatus Equicaccousia limihippi]